MKFKREYLLILVFLYLLFLLFQIKPRKAEWEKKALPLKVEEIREVTRFTKEFSFIETKDEKTLFEIYAKEVLAQKDTLIFLKNVLLTFYLKEGALKINCKEAKFDIEKKDADISGSVLVEFPNEMILSSENIFYQHNSGNLESPVLINILYKNFSGKCSSIDVNIFSEVFSIKDLEIQSSNALIYIPQAEGHIKKKIFYSENKSYIFYEKNLITSDRLSINFLEEKTILKGNCFLGTFSNLKDYSFFSEEFEGEFSSEDFQPIIFKFEKDVKVFGLEDNLKMSSNRSLLYFDKGLPSIFNFEGSVEIERDKDAIYCDVVNAYFKEKELDNVFFGDSVILCYYGWYINCNNLNYLQNKNILFLSGDVLSTKGYLKIKSNWMKIMEKEEKIIFGDGVEMSEINKDIRVRAKECTYIEKEKKAIFLNNVIAWTKDYTLKTKRLEMFEDKLLATGGAEINGKDKEENFTLKAEEINFKDKGEKIEALGSVFFKYDNYLINGYFLQIFKKEDKIQRLVLTDLVQFSTLDNLQKGSGELLEIYPEKDLLILEGCPCHLEDEKQGSIEAQKIFLLKEPLEIFVIDEKKGKIKYKGK